MLSGAATLSIPNRRERARRLVHFAFGAGAFLVPCVPIGWSIALAAGALAYNALVAPRWGLDRGYRREGERGVSGLVTYPLAVLVLLLVAPPDVAAGAWVVMAAADPVAAAVGTRCPRPRIRYQQAKSLIGSVAGWLAASVACGAYLSYAGLERPFLPALSAAAAGALAESVPWPLDDNLPIAVFAAATLWAWGL